MEAKIELPALLVRQPIGEFFVAVISSDQLLAISYADVRDLNRDFDKYLGIQRRLDKKRVRDIQRYTKTQDATFPTSILLAIEKEHADWDEESKVITLKSDMDGDFTRIAKILDGQHRVAGLEGYSGMPFDVCVSIFVNADLADQASIFSTVNLAQTKVVKSLVYDLYDYQQARSPQKTSHNVALALDGLEESPFRGRIKRLGFATGPGQFLTQATVVEELMRLITRDPTTDRDDVMRGRRLYDPTPDELRKVPFRKMFIDANDKNIVSNMLEFFGAVETRWEKAWLGQDRGQILPKTNGFKSLMYGLREIYKKETKSFTDVVSKERYMSYLSRIPLEDDDFNTANFQPGSTGQAALKRYFDAVLSGQLRLDT